MSSSGKNLKTVINQKTAQSIFAKLAYIFLKICSCKHMWKRTKS